MPYALGHRLALRLISMNMAGNGIAAYGGVRSNNTVHTSLSHGQCNEPNTFIVHIRGDFDGNGHVTAKLTLTLKLFILMA